MHVTACLAGQDDVDVEVGEECRSLQALKEAIVVALPQLCVEGFDVSVGGRALDDDEEIVSLVDSVTLDVVPNTRGLSALALREAGREVSGAGLLQAAEEGSVSVVTLCLDAGVPIDCVDDSDEATPLHLACSNGHVSVATLLLDRGCAIDETTCHGWKPLHMACIDGHAQVAALLLDRGSRAIDEKNGEGWTPLHLACGNGFVALAALLLDRGKTAIDEKNGDGWTPLHVSCRYGHLEVATLLLDRGSAIDEKTNNRETPLHLACCYGKVQVATLLLDRDCDFALVKFKKCQPFCQEVSELLLARRSAVLGRMSPANVQTT